MTLEARKRYSLCRPVVGGYSFWAITDHQMNVEVVTIYKGFPGAEYEMERLFAMLPIEERNEFPR